MYSGPSSTEEVQELVSKVLKLEGVRTMTRVTHTTRGCEFTFDSHAGPRLARGAKRMILVHEMNSFGGGGGNF